MDQLENIPTYIRALLAVIFFGVGMALLYFLGQVHNLNCTRTGPESIECYLETTWMQMTVLNTQPLPELKSASLAESCDDDGCTYRVELHTLSGSQPLDAVYTSDQSEQESIAQRINEYMSDSGQRSLKVQSGGGWILFVPLAFIGMAIFMTVSSFITQLRGG